MVSGIHYNVNFIKTPDVYCSVLCSHIEMQLLTKCLGLINIAEAGVQVHLRGKLLELGLIMTLGKGNEIAERF